MVPTDQALYLYSLDAPYDFSPTANGWGHPRCGAQWSNVGCTPLLARQLTLLSLGRSIRTSLARNGGTGHQKRDAYDEE